MADRKKVFAGNWKMNILPSEAADFVSRFCSLVGTPTDDSVILFPPAISLPAVNAALPASSGVTLGVQNVYWENEGAFTGEISVSMARDAGATSVLVGHSERRHIFGETTDETVQKVSAVLQGGLTAVLCVGEKIEARKQGRQNEVVADQLDPVLRRVDESSYSRLMIAYEPVWAIGTGETASPNDAAQMHGFIRDRIRERFAPATADQISILYGGSVKPDNAAELLSMENIDGVLVGGASLDPTTFSRICLSIA